jgi:hypothetical protein
MTSRSARRPVEHEAGILQGRLRGVISHRFNDARAPRSLVIGVNRESLDLTPCDCRVPYSMRPGGNGVS